MNIELVQPVKKNKSIYSIKWILTYILVVAIDQQSTNQNIIIN